MTRARDVANIDGLLTTTGDTYYASAAGTPARLGIGSTGNVLTVSGGVPAWSAPAGGGKVLQVVGSSTSTTVTNTAGTQVATGLTATITPTLSTSKILILISQHADIYATSTDVYGMFSLFKGATNINEWYGNFQGSSNGAYRPSLSSVVYYDAPATTSATTYSTRIGTTNIGSGRTAVAQPGSGLSTITLLEIGA
jgi:hypothetical protein